MNDFENIQRLLRLKRYETPGEDFVEDFVTQFRERQRSELLRQSARGLLWERVNTFFSDLVSPKWATAAATAAFAITAAWATLGVVGNSHNNSSMAVAAAEPLPSALQNRPSFAVDSELIKEATPQSDALKIESILLSRHFEGDDAIALTSSGSMAPISTELLPVSDFGR
ncbi:hypothetical protein SAMN02745166_02611 [Prosthecobacter debontii]|uniref:Uncharacterized protein n=1 Tax=Prosthecobacter debontii TaxID=48467 RepID=A0A1T4Y7J2_9BACT|nr:hypothetical protein [Prosthecobacter debontii]SKA97767.1 hypothetical protein SAMN02745166_02611 [Prosthecobacter debontii]